MGFFFDDAEKKEPEEEAEVERGRAAVKGNSPRKRASLIDPNRRGCDVCPLRSTWPSITSPQMPPMLQGDNPDILVLGEAPGAEEDQKGKVFIGKSGSFLRDLIPANFDERLVFQNSVRCRPPGNATPDRQEVHACSVYLEDDLERLSNVKAILGVGAVPLNKFIPGASILRMHGVRFPVEIGSRVLWYYPIFHPSYVMRTKGKFDEGPVYPVWQAEIKKFFKEVDDWPTPKIHKLDPASVIIPANREEAEALLGKMPPLVAVDIETTNLRPYNKGARLLMASFSDGETSIAFPINHPKAQTDWGMDLLFSTLEERRWIAHNATFELSWFLYHQAQLWREKELRPFEDTMAIARLYHQRETVLKLEFVSRVHLGVDVKAISNLNTNRIVEYPLEEALRYNGLDTLATAPIYHMLRRHVNKIHYERLLERIESFTMMQLLGLEVDAEAAAKSVETWEKIEHDYEKEALKTPTVKAFEQQYGEFNIRSSEQVGRALVEFGGLDLPKTPKGKQFKTDDETLKAADEDHPLVKAVLSFREASKQKGTYAVTALEIPKQTTDGLIHPCYSALHVATFRSSSEDPNIQNWPKRKHKHARRPIVAPEGHVIAAFDYGQLQVRILAMAARDTRLINDLVTGKDIHSHWLNRVLEEEPNYFDRLADVTGETDEKKIRKAGRTIIKSDFVFALFFGSTANSIATRAGLKTSTAYALFDEFWDEYKLTADWNKSRREYYTKYGEVKGLTGLVRHTILWGNETQNTPIQMGEAEIALGAQARLSRKALQTGDMYFHPRINVHDDLTFILPDRKDDELVQYIEIIAEEMVAVHFDWQICPLVVECAIGTNWAELAEVCSFTGDYIH